MLGLRAFPVSARQDAVVAGGNGR